MNKVFLAGSLVVGTIVFIGVTKPEEPYSPPVYHCDWKLTDIFAFDKVRRQYVEKILDAVQDGKAWKMETKDNEEMAEAALRRELKDGDEYLAHGCTENADEIRDVITGPHKIADERKKSARN